MFPRCANLLEFYPTYQVLIERLTIFEEANFDQLDSESLLILNWFRYPTLDSGDPKWLLMDAIRKFVIDSLILSDSWCQFIDIFPYKDINIEIQRKTKIYKKIWQFDSWFHVKPINVIPENCGLLDNWNFKMWCGTEHWPDLSIIKNYVYVQLVGW